MWMYLTRKKNVESLQKKLHLSKKWEIKIINLVNKTRNLAVPILACS